jgi:hypothetical protein
MSTTKKASYCSPFLLYCVRILSDEVYASRDNLAIVIFFGFEL